MTQEGESLHCLLCALGFCHPTPLAATPCQQTAEMPAGLSANCSVDGVQHSAATEMFASDAVVVYLLGALESE